MSIIANKRASMVLFGGRNNLTTQQVRMVLEEKEVVYENEIVEDNVINESLLELNPYGNIPTLVEKDVVLFIPQIIMTFLDERYPHPSLLPAYPVLRAQTRLLLYRIENDWISLFEKIEKSTDEKFINKNLKQIKKEIEAIAPNFATNPFFMSEEFSILDCYIAPLLWQLKLRGVEFDKPSDKPIVQYMNNLFNRPSFKKSIIETKQKSLL